MGHFSLPSSTKKNLTSQVYGTRDVSGANRNPVLTNGQGTREDSHGLVHLQLSQPQQQNYEEPARATKLGYDSFSNITLSIMVINFNFSNLDHLIFMMISTDYNYIRKEGASY